jgi:DNA polymerase-3 subunit delta
MKLKPEQIAAHLQKNLAPVYVVSGDEPLQVAEVCDAIRARARDRGCSERLVFNVEAGFDWNALLQARDTLSLFAEQRLVELRLPTGKPGETGAKVLKEYAERLPAGDVLLVIGGKIDKDAQRGKWFAALDEAGVVVQAWPLNSAQLPAWIERRMRARGLQPSAEAVSVLADRVEGNLLACAQEIEKLLLLQGAGAVDGAAVSAAVADSARYSVYDLADRALAGEAAAVTRVLRGLQGEGEEPTLALWALTREIRVLAAMADEMRRGAVLDQVLQRNKVWENRKALVRNSLKRSSPRRLRQLLRHAARVDRIIKGMAQGNPWDELLQLALGLAGIKAIGARPAKGGAAAA